MDFLYGLGLFVLLVLIDFLFVFLIKNTDAKKSYLMFMVTFIIGMFICLLYTVSFGYLLPEIVSFKFALGLFVSVLSSTIFKIIYTILKIK